MKPDWTDLFDAWQRAILEADEDPPAGILRSGADASAIEELEARLGTRLPPSYRAFLEHTNGAAALPGWGVVRDRPDQTLSDGLLTVDQVAWLRDYDPMVAQWGEPEPPNEEIRWHHPGFDPQESEREFLYPEEADHGYLKTGHFLYALAISAVVDGYHTALNPLVVDADGEWEAWDAGAKIPGANRHPSFAALLEADIAHQHRIRDHVAESQANVAGFVEAFSRRGSTVTDRMTAAWQAFSAGARAELVPDLGSIALDAANDLGPRQAALQLLGYIGSQEALDTLVRATADPDPRFQATSVPRLAISDDAAHREVAIQILADPATPDFVIGSIYRPAGDVVWEAYRRSGNPGLLPQLAYLGEERAADDVVAMLRDPGRTADELNRLVTYAYYLHDPRIAPALAACARRLPSWRTNVGLNLASSGFLDEAIPLLAEAMLADDGYGRAEGALALVRDPRAGDALLNGLRNRPTASLARAIGWHGSPQAVTALEAVLDLPDVHLGAIDALELIATPVARDVLAYRSDAGDGYATRALARLRDVRAREPLLTWLADTDPRLARIGADGLRDLRDPTTGPGLLAAAGHADADVAVCAVHAIVTMDAAETAAALEVLGRHADERARQLAAHWAARREAVSSSER